MLPLRLPAYIFLIILKIAPLSHFNFLFGMVFPSHPHAANIIDKIAVIGSIELKTAIFLTI